MWCLFCLLQGLKDLVGIISCKTYKVLKTLQVESY